MCCVMTDVFCQLVIMIDGCSFIYYTRFNKHRLSFDILLLLLLLLFHVCKRHTSLTRNTYFYIKPDDGPLGTKHVANC